LYELVNNLRAAPPEQQLPQVLANLQVKISALNESLPKLRNKITGNFPEYANLVRPKPASVEQVQQALKPDEAFVSILVTAQHTYVWAVPKQGAVAFTTSALTAMEVNNIVGTLRKSLDPGTVALGAIPEFDLAKAHRLYAELLKPVAPGWQAARNLVVAVNGALTQLPFALLPTEATATGQLPEKLLFAHYQNVPWLVRRVAITQMPSTNTLVTLRALPAANPARAAFAGFGNPVFGADAPTIVAQAQTQTRSPVRLRNLTVARADKSGTPASGNQANSDWLEYSKLPPLPDTQEEILSIADALKADVRKDVFLQHQASKHQVLTADLTNRRVIAFATHGLLPGDLPGLTQPALALSAPTDPNSKESGLLTLDDVLTLKLDADWVVLSACNTAAGNGAAAEAVSGLGRGFFYAGSRALLVTHWPVETISARVLVSGIFERYGSNASLTRAEALRQSILALLDSPGYVDPVSRKIVFSYAHPIFWAPYALVGDGGAAKTGG
jgi:CHAT domain-containing protein